MANKDGGFEHYALLAHVHGWNALVKLEHTLTGRMFFRRMRKQTVKLIAELGYPPMIITDTSGFTEEDIDEGARLDPEKFYGK
jgi:hypothetical protein